MSLKRLSEKIKTCNLSDKIINRVEELVLMLKIVSLEQRSYRFLRVCVPTTKKNLCLPLVTVLTSLLMLSGCILGIEKSNHELMGMPVSILLGSMY